MDRIVITKEDEEFLRGIRQELGKKEGMFEAKISMADTSFEVFLLDEQVIAVLKQTDSALTIKVEDYVSEKERLYMFSFEMTPSMQVTNLEYNDRIKNHHEARLFSQQLAADLTITVTLFFYVLNNYRDYQLVTTKEVTSQRVKTTKSKKKGVQKRVVRVVNKVIRISNDNDIRETVRKKAKRVWHVDEFGRRGHWRTYKNGKRVWVSATKVKTGAKTNKIGNKEYKL